MLSQIPKPSLGPELLFLMLRWSLFQGDNFSFSSEYELTKFCHHVIKTFALHLEGSYILHKRIGQADQDLLMQEQRVKLLFVCTCFLKC